MATYYVELQGGALRPSAQFCGGDIYPGGGGGGGGATLQTKSVSYTPTESAISASVTPDVGYDGMDQVNVSVGAISSTYVGSGITRNDSSDLTASGATVTAPAGYYASNGSKTIASAGAPEVYVATIESDGKITAQVDINNSGYIDADTYLATTPNAMVTPRSSSDLTALGATVTAPAGYYENAASKAIPNASTPYIDSASIDSSGNLSVDIEIDNAGFIDADTFPYTFSSAFAVQAAQTITPGTTNQTIASGKYLTGVQTILGDADLVAGNIKKGITIFGITGTYEGGGWVEETISTSGAVTKALDPYVLYHFTGALTSLTITLNAPSAGQIAHYHFDFGSPSTACTLTMPNTVTMPDSFSVEASKRYEVDVLNNFGSVIAWTA